MRICLLKEVAEHERRVALVPDAVGRLVAAGHEVVVEADAGAAAHFPDAAYAAAGAALVATSGDACRGAHVVTKVQRPTDGEVALLDEGAALVCLLQPAGSATVVAALAARRVTALALELVPAHLARAVHGRALLAEHGGRLQGVLLGAAELRRFLPMLTTAAGTLAPAKAFVIGRGVAGLQAIATARRLGAVVSRVRRARPPRASRCRAWAPTFVAREAGERRRGGRGGYARAQSAEEQRAHRSPRSPRTSATWTSWSPPRRSPAGPAPRLVTARWWRACAGSVIVDLAAETGRELRAHAARPARAAAACSCSAP
jgi:NAD(P) transhydrogenase subunit alpha